MLHATSHTPGEGKRRLSPVQINRKSVKGTAEKIALSFSMVYIQTDHYFEKTGSFPSTAKYL